MIVPVLMRKTILTLAVVIGSLAVTHTTMNAQLAAPAAAKTEFATLGGGCFWCLEAYYETFNGVNAVVSGYAGGKVPNPTYKQICTGTTGHAEVVQIEFDPSVITYEQILDVFWEIHDPTTLNQQGADVGTQYRSAVYYHNDAQKLALEKSIAAAKGKFKKPITTEVAPLPKFYVAEDYHQDYYRNNPHERYCAYVISPKLEKLRKLKKPGFPAQVN